VGGEVVRVFIRVLLILLASGNILGAFAQDTPRSGFAVVTVVSGNIAGLIATETLRNATSSGIEEAIVAPSALVTTGSMLVPVGLLEENTTGIAITNPSAGSGGVRLILTDEAGTVVLTATVQLGPLGHFSGLLNEFFVNQEARFPTPLLLTVSSEIPVALLVLNFRGEDFTAVPMTSLSSPTPVPPIANRPLLVPPSPAGSFVVPVTSTIGGGASLIFAQVAAGGGWSTEIAIGNTSAATQVVRVDFFGANGISTGSLTDIAIPPRGVFFFSPGPLAQPFI
jgi:hypothetical protein